MRRNVIDASCGKIMCPSMSVAPMAPLNETGAGVYAKLRPNVVVVAIDNQLQLMQPAPRKIISAMLALTT
jgi:hypothetical protein